MRALHEQGKTRATRCADTRRGLHHRREVPGRVPGLVQYYLLAQDVFRLGQLHWVMETSLLKTLAGKHRGTVSRIARQYKTTIETPDGPRIASRSPSNAIGEGSHWSPASAGSRSRENARPSSPTSGRSSPASKRNELIHRLLAKGCEICEARNNLEVHHIRKLADLSKPGRRENPPGCV